MPELNTDLVPEHVYTIEDKYWEAQHFIDTLHMEIDNYEFNLQKVEAQLIEHNKQVEARLNVELNSH